jgi:DNA-binding transcriptional ArsR family regulator
MGITKTDLFDAEVNEIAGLLKALGHPARIAIVQYVLAQKTCVCSNLVEILPLAQATISQHLKALKEAGIVKGTVEGTSVCYCIDEERFRFIQNYMEGLSLELSKVGNCC